MKRCSVFLYILTMSQHIYIFWLSNSKLLYRKSDYDNHYLIWSIQYKAIYETTEYMIGWWNKWERSKNISLRLLRLRDLGSQHADWKPIINKVSGSDMCYMCIVLKCSSGHPNQNRAETVLKQQSWKINTYICTYIY